MENYDDNVFMEDIDVDENGYPFRRDSHGGILYPRERSLPIVRAKPYAFTRDIHHSRTRPIVKKVMSTEERLRYLRSVEDNIELDIQLREEEEAARRAAYRKPQSVISTESLDARRQGLARRETIANLSRRYDAKFKFEPSYSADPITHRTESVNNQYADWRKRRGERITAKADSILAAQASVPDSIDPDFAYIKCGVHRLVHMHGRGFVGGKDLCYISKRECDGLRGVGYASCFLCGKWIVENKNEIERCIGKMRATDYRRAIANLLRNLDDVLIVNPQIKIV